MAETPDNIRYMKDYREQVQVTEDGSDGPSGLHFTIPDGELTDAILQEAERSGVDPATLLSSSLGFTLGHFALIRDGFEGAIYRRPLFKIGRLATLLDLSDLEQVKFTPPLHDPNQPD
ncbi:MAG TPA: hypothetical protein VMR34_03215 [Candidatus Saccharimonadales bacterium]|nr:hypothetical protein [Candidatus Saccharimonadales bacterium]